MYKPGQILLLVCFLTISACSVKKTEAPKPNMGATKSINLPLSTINIPIRLNCVDLENSINKLFIGVLYNDDSYDNNNADNLLLKITKIGDFKIIAINDKFTITAPLEIYVKGRLKKDFFSLFDQSVGIDQSKDATFRINVVINTKLSISSNWDIITKSEASFQWRERPYLELGPIKIPIASIIESAVNSQIKEVNNKLDAEVSRLIKIKPTIEKYWNDFQQPKLINEQYQSYLQLKPESIAATNIKSDGKTISFYTALKSEINIFSGTKPLVDNIKPLPNLSQNQKADSSFSLFFGTEIKYDFATALAKKEFVGKTFTYENNKQSVTVNDLSFFGNGDQLGVKINVNGFAKKGLFTKKFKGDLYALGTPVYDPITKVLLIKNFDFDLKSKDVLLGTSEWLFKGTFKKQIEGKLAYSLKSDIENSSKIANDALKNAKFNNIRLDGKIEDIDLEGIYIGEESIKVIIKSTGILAVKLLNF